MTDFNQFHDSIMPENPAKNKKIPDMLNVLSILTIIACVLFLLQAVYNYFAVCKSLKMMEKLTEEGNNPMSGMMSSMSDAIVKQCELRLPILIITVVSLALCFFGALQMRKLKRLGFFLYLLGQLLLPVASMMMGLLSGPLMLTLAWIFPVLFLILYATQLKHLR